MPPMPKVSAPVPAMVRRSAELPYFLAGAGVYNTKADVDNAEGSTSAGINFGLGAKFSLTGFSTFAEARVHYLFKKQGSSVLNEGYNPMFIPITFGILF